MIDIYALIDWYLSIYMRWSITAHVQALKDSNIVLNMGKDAEPNQ